MRRIAAALILVALLVFALAGCEPPPPETHTPMDAASATAAEGTIRLFSDALAAGDSTRFATLTDPAFTLLEDGRFYSRDSALAGIRSVLATGALGREPDSIHAVLSDSAAWASYRVHAWFARGRDTMRFTMLENVVLRRDVDSWRVVQMATMQEARPAAKK